ncbi:MAG: tRNA (adenosine(37)-N6)-threonylcarbamoyltransferase complex ATPase subunit type 1 TsaE [Gammaproteobacteria bacterium]|nr:tRNA (adenosine(37)-N6)-threonylcarbamoyltransferase complex ATPase subunit type 1 TsaE [Gammaproteobacteria bacterium]MDE0508160.1 tRNA (adenosine(37)-N6)-threonylcarbamoyltransferase complex ATPase subunit type 1 TsaE [Gammaproteobacteria bacterium]
MRDFNGQLENEAATLHIGRLLAAATLEGLQAPDGSATVIHLHGELGAGKTTLARGILRGYGYKGPVKSPTYTLVEPYELDRRRIYHFDLYRLTDPGEMEFLGTEEYFVGGNLCIVEWARRGGERIPSADLEIELWGEGAGRSIACTAHTGAGIEMVTEMVKKLRAGVDV